MPSRRALELKAHLVRTPCILLVGVPAPYESFFDGLALLHIGIMVYHTFEPGRELSKVRDAR